MRIGAVALLMMITPAFGQIGEQRLASPEQRLGMIIGSLYVENARLSIELERAKQTIEQLQAELQKMKEEKK
jgi:hypothetical protein